MIISHDFFIVHSHAHVISCHDHDCGHISTLVLSQFHSFRHAHCHQLHTLIFFCNFHADVPIVVKILFFSTIRVHCQPLGPTNISRQIGDTNVIIPCPYSYISPPIWSIGGVLYDYSALPPPYATAAGGDLVIRTVDDSLNNVSFQCIVTTTDGEILQSDIGILTVTGISNGI